MAGINFKAFDLGGHEIARRVWKDYYAKVCTLATLCSAAAIAVLLLTKCHTSSLLKFY